MLTKLELIINGSHSLALPAESFPISLIRNEFNLLTNNIAEMRPLSISETFEIPLEENRRVFDSLKGQEMTAELKYNDVILMSGPVTEYSVDEQRQRILVTIISAFKAVVDFMGNNTLFLDLIDLSRWNYIVPEHFDKTQSNGLLKFGRYNPMDTSTGRIEYDQQNEDDYCKPSLNLWGYFKEVFRMAGWTADWDAWDDLQRSVCLLPTVPYTCSSWGLDLKGEYTIPANGSLQIPISGSQEMWNIISNVLGTDTPGMEIIGGNSVQVRQPNRLMSFKVKAQYYTTEAFNLSLMDGEREMAWIQSLGDDTINYISDSNNLQEGIDPLALVIGNPNPYDITINFNRLEFYNLFSVYETNQDDYLSPVGYMFPVSENFPKLTAIDVYRQILALFQMAQKTEDDLQEVQFYQINDVFEKTFERVDVNPYLLWEGYTILSDKINGLAKLNAIRYKGDTKRQRFFKVDIAPLPASAVYFDSLFAHGETNKEWDAVTIPALQYKVKTVDSSISIEYLEWKDTVPQLGYYDDATGAMRFEDLHITKIVGKYWSNILTYLSSYDGYNPVVYKLRLRLFYHQYKQLFGQDNLFYYQSNSLLVGATYDAVNQIFEGTFLSVR